MNGPAQKGYRPAPFLFHLPEFDPVQAYLGAALAAVSAFAFKTLPGAIFANLNGAELVRVGLNALGFALAHALIFVATLAIQTDPGIFATTTAAMMASTVLAGAFSAIQKYYQGSTAGVSAVAVDPLSAAELDKLKGHIREHVQGMSASSKIEVIPADDPPIAAVSHVQVNFSTR